MDIHGAFAKLLSINLDDMAGHKILYQILFVLDVIFLMVAKTSAFKIVDLSISFVCVALNLIVEILSKEQSTMMA